MEQNRSSFRTSLSLMASVLFHSLAILLIALGPTFIPGLSGEGDRKSENVEITLNEVAAPAAVETPTPTPAPAQVAEVIKPVAKPEVKPVTKNVVVKAAPKKLPAKTTIEEQPVLAAENTETPLETVAVAEQLEQTEQPEQSEAAADEPAAETTTEEVAPVAATTAEEVAAVTAPAAAATHVAGTGDDAVKSESAEGNHVVAVTQNYLGLKQESGNTPPRYSRDMRIQQLQGRGQLVYFVTKEGKVTDVKLTKSTGSKILDQAAIDAFSNYKFVPGQEGYTQHDFEFSLKGPAETMGSRLRTTYNRQ